MGPVDFDKLLNLYRHTDFDPAGDQGTVSLETQELIDLLRLVESDHQAARDANIVLQDDVAQLKLGAKVRIQIHAPKGSLGLFVRTFDELLLSNAGTFKEPANYFAVEGKIYSSQRPPADIQVRYRQALMLVGILTEAATYADQLRGELVFVSDGKLRVPIQFTSDDLMHLDLGKSTSIADMFSDQLHRDQKLGILAQCVINVTKHLPASGRFAFLLRSLDVVAEELQGGYRIFASSFSYARVQNELQNARLEFINKIHKTFVDIQGQLLGIPVATFIVASQLKKASECDLSTWTNFAVVLGAWIFVILLAVSVTNQWLTIGVLSEEIERQKKKMVRDFGKVDPNLSATFDGLKWRVLWHKFAFGSVLTVGLIGALAGTYAYQTLTTPGVVTCFGK